MREILTLLVDNINTRYYIQFEKDRKRFIFQPTLKNRAAPSFTILVEQDELITRDSIQPALLQQARDKVKEILTSSMFDKF